MMRKALIENLIAEIKITGANRVVPGVPTPSPPRIQ